MGIYPVPLPAGYFSAFSSCLCCCVCGGLSAFWQFVAPLYCGGSLLWVGLDGWLVKASWLGKLVAVFWWVELDFFPLEWNEVSSSEFWDVSGFGVTLGSLYIEAQGYVPILPDNLHGMSCSGTCWLLDGTCFQCRYGGFWWALNDWWSLQSGVLWYSQVLGLSLMPLVFSLVLTADSRLLHLYSIDDKASSLMMKSFSTVRDTQRGTQSYMEKRRGRRDIEVTRRREGESKEERVS